MNILINKDCIKRIQEENLWDDEYTIRVIDEYIKFLTMAKDKHVCPSYEIDQVWHTHMLYSKDYTALTTVIVGYYLHHDPTPSEEKNNPNRIDPYNDTLSYYVEAFGYYPPRDIWTHWTNRKNAYIDLNSHWVIPAGDWKALVKLFFKYIKSIL